MTGNGWKFPIDRVSATVTLPAGASDRIRTLEGYTGPSGATGKDVTASIDYSGAIQYRTTRRLGLEEGLTLVVAWPKGYLEEPDGAREKIDLILKRFADRSHLIFLPGAGIEFRQQRRFLRRRGRGGGGW